MLRRILLGVLMVTVLLASTPLAAQAAAPTLSGTFTTQKGPGTISFTAVKAVYRIGSQGNYIISGKTYPGMLYAIRGTSNLGMVWYYGSTGITAGSAVVLPTATTGVYSGTIEFVDKAGNVTASGTVTITLK